MVHLLQQASLHQLHHLTPHSGARKGLFICLRKVTRTILNDSYIAITWDPMHGVTIVKLALLVAMDISRSVKASHFSDIGNLGRASGKQRNFV